MEKSLKKNTLFNIIKTCSTILFPLIVFPYTSRILLPENIGKVNFATSFVSYFSLLAGLGISTYAIRECASVRKCKDSLNEISSQIFSINMIFTLLSYVLLFFSLIFLKKIDSYRYLILIESTTILFTTIGADWINSAMEDFKYITLRTILFQILSLILIFIFVRNHTDYYKYAIISVLSSSGANIMNCIYRKKYCDIYFTKQIQWKKHMTPIFFLFVMMLSQTIFNNVDITMLGFMKGDYEVGLYSTAHKITKIVGQVVQSLSLVIIPRLSLYFANNDFDEVNRLLKKVLQFNISLGFPCVVGVELLAKEIVYIVGGKDFISAAPIIRILILAFLFSLVGGSFLGNAILIPMKKEKYYMIVCMIAAVINAIMNFLLIPKFGANGAAVATAINGFVIFALLYVRKDMRIKINKLFDVFFAPIIGCVGITLVCVLLNIISNIYIKVSLCVICSSFVYGLILYLMKYDVVVENISLIKDQLIKKGVNKK